MTDKDPAATLREASAEGWRRVVRVVRADQALDRARVDRDALAREVAERSAD